MLVIESVPGVREYLRGIRESGQCIGFVPTMGFLHEGHLQLVRESIEANDFTVTSIFVNPIQFNNPEDLKKYPRDLERDLELLRFAGCDLVFVPSSEEMYPDEVKRTYDLGSLEEVMEGFYRPGHFQGVAAVVHRLFDILKPHRAYFGMKDFQQLQVIRRLVEKEQLPVSIVPCETVREFDGLAMSSRNVRLGERERMAAPGIYAALSFARSLFPHNSPEEILKQVKEKLMRIAGFELEYFEIVDTRSLQPVDRWDAEREGVIACVAGYLGGVRLIDNMLL